MTEERHQQMLWRCAAPCTRQTAVAEVHDVGGIDVPARGGG